MLRYECTHTHTHDVCPVVVIATAFVVVALMALHQNHSSFAQAGAGCTIALRYHLSARSTHLAVWVCVCVYVFDAVYLPHPFHSIAHSPSLTLLIYVIKCFCILIKFTLFHYSSCSNRTHTHSHSHTNTHAVIEGIMRRSAIASSSIFKWRFPILSPQVLIVVRPALMSRGLCSREQMWLSADWCSKGVKIERNANFPLFSLPSITDAWMKFDRGHVLRHFKFVHQLA